QLSQSEINGFKIAWEKAPFKIDIESLFKNSRAKNTDNNNLLNDPATQKGEFFVVLLSGDKYSLKLEEIQSVRALKAELTKRIKVDGSKQKLLHKGVELQKDDGSWDVLEVGRVSNGNAKDYSPIKRAILELNLDNMY
ncbi:19917_t:CDS:2, partial [Racocetra fulgida]